MARQKATPNPTSRSPQVELTTSIRLITADDFHYGFSENIDEIADHLPHDHGAHLETTYHGFEDHLILSLRLFGEITAVENVRQKIEEAAKNVVHLTWQ